MELCNNIRGLTAKIINVSSCTDATNINTTATFTAGQEVEYNPVLSIEGWGQVVNPFNPPRVQFSRTLGNKAYELTDHLGNVAVTVTDRKIAARPVNILNPVPAYFAEVKSTQDYYPFGMEIKERSSNTYKFAFGFNGKENLMEVNGWQDYGERMYNRLTCRFPTPDKLIITEKKYPELSSYQFASNSPIIGIDLDGKEFLGVGYLVDKLSEGAAKIGLVRTAGFINSYGHSVTVDPIYSSHQFVSSLAKKDYSSSLKQLDITGVSSVSCIFKTAKDAIQGDAYSQGLIFGMLPGILGGIKGGKKIVGEAESNIKSLGGEKGNIETNAYKHSFKYSDRVRMRATQDPSSHNFPYSFDDAILSNNPILKKNGYQIFQKLGSMNGKNGIFEIGLTKENIIDHRFFRPNK